MNWPKLCPWEEFSLSQSFRITQVGLQCNPVCYWLVPAYWLTHPTPEDIWHTREKNSKAGGADSWPESGLRIQSLYPVPKSTPFFQPSNLSLDPPTAWAQPQVRGQGNPNAHSLKISLLGQEQSEPSRAQGHTQHIPVTRASHSSQGNTAFPSWAVPHGKPLSWAPALLLCSSFPHVGNLRPP